MKEWIRRIGSFLLGGGIVLIIMTPLFYLLNWPWLFVTLPVGVVASLTGFLIGGLDYRDQR